MILRMTGLRKSILHIIAGIWLLTTCSSPSGSDSGKEKNTGTADQIHYSVINSTSVKFDWVGTDSIISFGRNPGTIHDSPEISCCGEDWGWFDYGNTRFISLPEPWTTSVRQEWKKQVTKVSSDAQNDADIRLIVTYGHWSAYQHIQ